MIVVLNVVFEFIFFETTLYLTSWSILGGFEIGPAAGDAVTNKIINSLSKQICIVFSYSIIAF